MSTKKTNINTIILLQLLFLFLSFSSLASKIASSKPLFSLEFIFYYGIMLSIFFIYALIWQQIIKKISLTVAFCNKSVLLIWGMIFGKIIFKEVITLNMIIGCFFVIIGILVVNKDVKH